MKRWIKWTATGTLLLGLVVVATATSGLYLAEQKRNRHIDIKPRPVAYTTEAQTIERGRYLYASRGCTDCHGAQGTGREFVNDGKGTRIVGPNITPAGVVARYQPEDWNSMIRHGVKPNGRPLLVMPSEDYNRFTNDDLNALVSYVRQFKPQQGLQAVIDLPRPAWVLYGLGAIPDAAARIDHQLAPSRPVPAGVTLANGQYVANMCIGCHGADLSGGKIPGAPPDWPAASNLRPGKDSALARYASSESFVAMLRSGKRPDGTPIQVMPFESLGQLSDVDARALYLFLTAPGGQARAGGAGEVAGALPGEGAVSTIPEPPGAAADAQGLRSNASPVPSVPSGLRMPG
ncbi:class I cytochrome c [Acidovorax sp. NO-1]|uniref:c-type cytochrome n=1 Tax=Acidovorax sp. NO-1 TaxID=512030 RepID=UPI00023FD035|nr:cytochrome c [Acidovorax sp. NO-1]EHL23636.1 class I cytochrome c [Acidovorax sp. NO-1]